MVIPYNQKILFRARDMRNKSTHSEVLLWKRLRAKQLGVSFLRQKTIRHSIIDFYCPYLKLAIEIDGSSHNDKYNEDLFRQGELEFLGVKFLRFTDVEVLHGLDSVVKKIRNYVDEAIPLG
ncbi:MAG: DUF559 domain-containing protein [Candidatus Taylorbacteria bacterium]|nr:DUF559 domain-containing protein [Candidatus Taylorbacteria bacterium]